MKLSIFGPREYSNQYSEEQLNTVFSQLYEKLKEKNLTLIHGGAKGVQQKAVEFFTDKADIVLIPLADRMIPTLPWRPSYFYFRNVCIVDNSDLVVIFDSDDAEAATMERYVNEESPQTPLIKISK